MDRNQRILVADVLGHFLTGYAARLRRDQKKDGQLDENSVRRRIRYASIAVVAWVIGYLFASAGE